jgi:hypothetical protein
MLHRSIMASEPDVRGVPLKATLAVTAAKALINQLSVAGFLDSFKTHDRNAISQAIIKAANAGIRTSRKDDTHPTTPRPGSQDSWVRVETYRSPPGSQ